METSKAREMLLASCFQSEKIVSSMIVPVKTLAICAPVQGMKGLSALRNAWTK